MGIGLKLAATLVVRRAASMQTCEKGMSIVPEFLSGDGHQSCDPSGLQPNLAYLDFLTAYGIEELLAGLQFDVNSHAGCRFIGAVRQCPKSDAVEAPLCLRKTPVTWVGTSGVALATSGSGGA